MVREQTQLIPCFLVRHAHTHMGTNESVFFSVLLFILTWQKISYFLQKRRKRKQPWLCLLASRFLCFYWFLYRFNGLWFAVNPQSQLLLLFYHISMHRICRRFFLLRPKLGHPILLPPLFQKQTRLVQAQDSVRGRLQAARCGSVLIFIWLWSLSGSLAFYPYFINVVIFLVCL